MITGVDQQSIFTSLGRYWYGLPPWPTGQYAWRRQFDAGQYLSDLFFPNMQPPANPLESPFFIELNALAILQDQLTLGPAEPESTEDALAKLIAGRLWPTNWPPSTGPHASPVQTLSDGSPLLGQILNILA
jgi:hypothetical protein